MGVKWWFNQCSWHKRVSGWGEIIGSWSWVIRVGIVIMTSSSWGHNQETMVRTSGDDRRLDVGHYIRAVLCFLSVCPIFCVYLITMSVSRANKTKFQLLMVSVVMSHYWLVINQSYQYQLRLEWLPESWDGQSFPQFRVFSVSDIWVVSISLWSQYEVLKTLGME